MFYKDFHSMKQKEIRRKVIMKVSTKSTSTLSNQKLANNQEFSTQKNTNRQTVIGNRNVNLVVEFEEKKVSINLMQHIIEPIQANH